MAHVYATLNEFKGYLTETATDFGSASDARLVAVLEAASRRIDSYCNRSLFGSGFGPRVGTNRYDGQTASVLELDDDLLALTGTTITVLDGTAGTAHTLTTETDFFLLPYDKAPYRRLVVHDEATENLYSGTRNISIAGTWGYQNTTKASTTAAEMLDTSATDVDVTSSGSLSICQTILIGSEQMYVTGIASATLTVERGANGTTAAVHANLDPVYRYTYPAIVTDVCIRLAQRRWKARDAGLIGDYGEGTIPGSSMRDSELGILWDLNYLREWA